MFYNCTRITVNRAQWGPSLATRLPPPALVVRFPATTFEYRHCEMCLYTVEMANGVGTSFEGVGERQFFQAGARDTSTLKHEIIRENTRKHLSLNRNLTPTVTLTLTESPENFKDVLLWICILNHLENRLTVVHPFCHYTANAPPTSWVVYFIITIILLLLL